MKNIQLLLTIFLLSVPLYAEKQKKSYVGLAVGQSSYNDGGFSKDIEKAIDRLGYTSTVYTNYNSTGYKLYGGNNFNETFSLESSYTLYGKSSFKIGSGASTSINPTSLAISLNVGYNFNKNRELRTFVLLGPSLFTFNEQGLVTYKDDFVIALRYGLGIDYSPDTFNRFMLRVAYEGDYYDTGIYKFEQEIQDSYMQNSAMLYFAIGYQY